MAGNFKYWGSSSYITDSAGYLKLCTVAELLMMADKTDQSAVCVNVGRKLYWKRENLICDPTIASHGFH